MRYGLLAGDGFKHGMVKHGAGEFSYYDYRHDATHHTNSVETFWRLLKNSSPARISTSARSITHIHVSAKYMDRYLSEFAFRSNHRAIGNAIFNLLIASI